MSNKIESLFGEEFEIKVKEKSVKDIIKRANEVKEKDPEKVLKSKKISLHERLAIIDANVLRILGHRKSNIIVIKDRDTFAEYIADAISSGRIAIDTETNNTTDTVNCSLMGLCLYYPGGKQAYIPINHRNPDTKERLPWQLTEQDCRAQLDRINQSGVFKVMHNGKFDYEVLKTTCDAEVVPDWDTIVAARLIDENLFKDERTSLKYIYTQYIDRTQKKYDIESLFENIHYADVDPEIFAYYASQDSFMTDNIYLWERETFFDKPENQDVLKLFNEIEMPIIKVTADIELYGVLIDQELGERLKSKYNGIINKINDDLNNILIELKPQIDTWRLSPEANSKTKSYPAKKTKMSKEKIEQTYTEIDSDGKRFKYGKAKVEQLPDDINLSSTAQLAILLYDILDCPILNKAEPRKTGEDDLTSLMDALRPDINKSEKAKIAYNICDKILEMRGVSKLISTYIDVIPDLAKHWKDGRIRYLLNSTGTDTGRFSSGGKFKYLTEDNVSMKLNSINSQNIPSHGDGALTRLLFKASPGCRIVGSDYSGQELRLAAYISQDKMLLDAYENDRDAYAIIASQVFDCSYEDCLEFHPEGTAIEIDGQKVVAGKKTHLNPEGKERRGIGKIMVLAGNYGMNGASAGALMGKTAKEGTELLDKYFHMFTGLGSAIAQSKDDLRKNGYVSGLLGRRRRLPDISLPYYTVSLDEVKDGDANFNPFLLCANRDTENPLITKWKNKIDKAVADHNKFLASKNADIKNSKEMGYKTFEKLQKEALADGIILQSNSGKIAQAERQCFNALIQGSAGTLTKKAMIDIANDPQLKEWGTHLIVTVHDEVLVECKEEYAELVEKRLPEIMINAARELGITSPKMQCDPYNVSRWYSDNMAASILKEFNKAKSKGLSREDAITKVVESHIEIPRDAIVKTIETGCDLEF